MAYFRIILFHLFVVVSIQLPAQEEKIYQSIRLDSITIVASNEFDTKRFIQQTIEDTTYLMAFSNLRVTPHRIKSAALVIDRRENEKATRLLKAKQGNKGTTQWIEMEEQEIKGKIYDKKGNHRYYTLEMYDRAFIPADTKKVDRIIYRPNEVNTKQGKVQKHKDQAKLFMFNPGSDIESVPFIGDKLSIFDDDMVKYYDYKISKVTKEGVECYLFTCVAKEEFPKRHTVIKELATYYHAETMQVLYRSYHLEANTVAFSFNVKMRVNITRIRGVYMPNRIDYSGYWNIPLKMRESISFSHEVN